MRWVALLSVVLLTGCAGLRPPKDKEPQEGDIARVTFVNVAPVTSIINIFEDSEACGQKRFGIFLGSGYQTTHNVRANVPFTYLQGWERTEARAARIDSLSKSKGSGLTN